MALRPPRASARKAESSASTIRVWPLASSAAALASSSASCAASRSAVARAARSSASARSRNASARSGRRACWFSATCWSIDVGWVEADDGQVQIRAEWPSFLFRRFVDCTKKKPSAGENSLANKPAERGVHGPPVSARLGDYPLEVRGHGLPVVLIFLKHLLRNLRRLPPQPLHRVAALSHAAAQRAAAREGGGPRRAALGGGAGDGGGGAPQGALRLGQLPWRRPGKRHRTRAGSIRAQRWSAAQALCALLPGKTRSALRSRLPAFRCSPLPRASPPRRQRVASRALQGAPALRCDVCAHTQRERKRPWSREPALKNRDLQPWQSACDHFPSGARTRSLLTCPAEAPFPPPPAAPPLEVDAPPGASSPAAAAEEVVARVERLAMKASSSMAVQLGTAGARKWRSKFVR